MIIIKLKIFLCCFLSVLLIPISGFAQEVEMADAMRANGKIYVVIAVVLVILIGILIYIFQTDRKLKQLEKEVDSLENKK
ncbi:CcmD family protein [Hyphobacterium sp. CCMP332]|nr:CcmD family protein [Hyphobacterium sp. CCMP332]